MNGSDFVDRPHCPACGTTGRAAFSTPYANPALKSALLDFYAKVGGLDYPAIERATYEVARCPECSTWFQTRIPSDSILAKLYEEWIDPEKARLRFHHHHSPHQSLRLACEVALALSLARASAPRTALDYGCGWGEWSRMTQAFGSESWGTELSATRRAHAEKSGVRVEADADLPDRYFGLVNLDQVLEHVPDPLSTLRLLAAKLHPDGILRLAVPNAWRVARALKYFDRELARPRLGGLNAIAPLEHLNAFTNAGLLRLAARCGLAPVRPAIRPLLATLVLPPGLTSTAKALLKPLYLRSRHCTQLYFRRSAIPA